MNNQCHGFRCDDGQCIVRTWLCDLESDCSSGEDEQRCSGKVRNLHSLYRFSEILRLLLVTIKFQSINLTDFAETSTFII